MYISKQDMAEISVLWVEMVVMVLATISTTTWHAMLTKGLVVRVMTATLLTEMVLVLMGEGAWEVRMAEAA